MKTKKMLALCMTGAMLASSLPVGAVYEEKATLLSSPFVAISGNKQIEGAIADRTDKAETIFKVGDQTFVLLDQDENGNYLIISSKTYSHKWDTAEWTNESRMMHKSIKKQNADGTFSYSVENLTENQMKELAAATRFNPEIETSLAYWLNNSYLNETLPKEISENVVEKKWDTEGYTIPSNTIWINGTFRQEMIDNMKDEAGNSLYTQDIDYARKKCTTSDYRVNAKVVIPSYSEYEAYKDKIAIKASHNDWRGELLRTTYASAMAAQIVEPTETDKSEEWWALLYAEPLFVNTYTENDTDIVRVKMDLKGENSRGAEYYVQPMFFVNSDFFKSVKVTEAGADVLAEIKKCSFDDLKDIYSAAELEAMNYDIPETFRGCLNYPTHGTAKNQSSIGMGNLTSPKENVFYVKNDAGETKGFILLDRDKDGNYFVMADDTYGTYKFYSGDKADDLNLEDSEWAFNPENENSVAHWLNDESDTGFVTAKKFPEAVYDNIVPFDWQLENKNINIWETPKIETVGEDAMLDYDAWTTQALKAGSASTAADPRFKLALMSATEFVTYKDKIGLPVTGWKGHLTRSMVSRVQVIDGAITIDSWAMRMTRELETDQMQIVLDGKIRNTDYPIRPVFWLDKDFFKTVKVEFADAEGNSLIGSKVLTQIKQYARYELKSLYTAEQMDEMDIPYIFEVREFNFEDGNGNALTSINGATAIKVKAVITSDKEKTADLYVAVYDGENNLVKTNIEPINVTEGKDTYSVELSGLNCGTNYKLKAFVWEKNMKPVAAKQF